jgi:hypothetical protein
MHDWPRVGHVPQTPAPLAASETHTVPGAQSVRAAHGWPAAIFATHVRVVPVAVVLVWQKLPSGQVTIADEQSSPIATVVFAATQTPMQQATPDVQALLSQFPERQTSLSMQAAPVASVPLIASPHDDGPWADSATLLLQLPKPVGESYVERQSAAALPS